ncbi:hypothetical protein ACSBR1_008890 [Camellia fascicularis]
MNIVDATQSGLLAGDTLMIKLVIESMKDEDVEMNGCMCVFCFREDLLIYGIGLHRELLHLCLQLLVSYRLISHQ